MSAHLRQAWASRITAAKFSPSQVATWEQTEPWNASRQEIEWQNVPGIYYSKRYGTEIASYGMDKITVTDAWFELPSATRRAILYHEAGHGLEDRFDWSTPIPAFGLANLDQCMGWRGAQGLGLNYSEALAEAYSACWCSPEWFGAQGDVRWKNLIEWMARKEGFPLP